VANPQWPAEEEQESGSSFLDHGHPAATAGSSQRDGDILPETASPWKFPRMVFQRSGLKKRRPDNRCRPASWMIESGNPAEPRAPERRTNSTSTALPGRRTQRFIFMRGLQRAASRRDWRKSSLVRGSI